MLKSMKFWLIVSVCINLLFLGAFIGGASKAHRDHGRVRPPANEVTAVMRSLPEDKREQLARQFRQMPPPAGDGRSLQQLADVIAAKPYDPTLVEDYFNRQRAANDKRIMRAQQALLATLDAMSDEERTEMAEKLREMPMQKHARSDGSKRRN